MRIIKLNAIDSTNTFLRQISSADLLEDYTVVVSDFQTSGKGQMGTQWLGQDGKNLTFSVFKETAFVSAQGQFALSIVASLSVYQALKGLNIPRLFIKWPNDILADNKKVCGILIENVILQGTFTSSIIGIGLNVNQTKFAQLPNATSLLNLLGRPLDTDEIMHAILNALQDNFKRLEKGGGDSLIKAYEDELFRKNKPSTFKDTNNQLFTGIIQGVTQKGRLKVLLEDDIIKRFDLKEIQLLY